MHEKAPGAAVKRVLLGHDLATVADVFGTTAKDLDAEVHKWCKAANPDAYKDCKQGNRNPEIAELVSNRESFWYG